jgi:hypothetical protein
MNNTTTATWIRQRITAMLKTPSMYGTLEEVELQIILLLEVIDVANGHAPVVPHWEAYQKFCHKLWDFHAPGYLSRLSRYVEDDESFSRLMAEFIQERISDA